MPVIAQLVTLMEDPTVEIVVQGGTVGEDGAVHPEEGYNVKFSHPTIQETLKKRGDAHIFTTNETKKFFSLDQLTAVCNDNAAVANVCLDTKADMLMRPPLDRAQLTDRLYRNGTNIHALLQLAKFSASDETPTHVKSALWLLKQAATDDPCATFTAALQSDRIQEFLKSADLDAIKASGIDPDQHLLLNLAFVSEFKREFLLLDQKKDAKFFAPIIPHAHMYDAVAVLAHFFNFKLSSRVGELDPELWELYKHHTSGCPQPKKSKTESGTD
jgi:hypothetical protein